MTSEASFQTAFTRWAKYNLPCSTACELKLEKGNSLPFSAVKEHQIRNLLIVKHGGFGYKIPDVGYGQKPFDFFTLKGDAYIVIMFYKKGQKEFVMIDVETFVTESERSERRSLTEERAKEIGTLCFLSPTG